MIVNVNLMMKEPWRVRKEATKMTWVALTQLGIETVEKRMAEAAKPITPAPIYTETHDSKGLKMVETGNVRQ